jgi:ectoine hydroxylase-related dioxygenase (phytanoyl-CoA dioxygenase family)
MHIEHFSGDHKTAGIVAALDRDGAVVLDDRIAARTVSTISAELRAVFAARGNANKRDLISPDIVFAKCRSAVEQIGHPCVLRVADSVLCRHGSGFQLSAATALEIRAGAAAEDLEPDASIYNMRLPGVEWVVSATWALDDLTHENGAPVLIPGSHRSDKMRWPKPEDVVTVPLPRGSVLVSMGWTLRGWSANLSASSTAVLINRYCLGWLRPEVNYALSMPGSVVASCPPHIRRLAGFQSYDSGRLGWYPFEKK